MGMYDSYGDTGIQIKAAQNPSGLWYHVGDICDLADGIYLAYDGVVMVRNSTVIFADSLPVYSKWGDVIDCREEFLNKRNPVFQTSQEVIKKWEGRLKTSE